MFLSIDIGGTKTLLALFSYHGRCLRRFKFDTSPSATQFLKDLSQNLAGFVPANLRSKILATTVAIPGVVKIEQDSYSFKFGNLEWRNIDLLTPIKTLFSGKVFFANDANLATLYESTRFGRKHGKSVYLTFSTGIGGGIAENGQLNPSSDAFEPGHVKYEYNDNRLEWEDIASAKTLSENYHSSLKDLKLDTETTQDLIARLSLGLLDILEQEEPETLIIGGPLGFILKKLKKPLLKSLRQSIKTLPKIKRAKKPNESVIYGAYLYSKQNYRK